jgi:hypothetical protein
MLMHMRTTVDLNDELLAQAKDVARKDGVTLREVFETALRSEIARRSQDARFTLRDASFRGDGLQPEFADATWARLRDAAYEGRGA